MTTWGNEPSLLSQALAFAATERKCSSDRTERFSTLDGYFERLGKRMLREIVKQNRGAGAHPPNRSLIHDPSPHLARGEAIQPLADDIQSFAQARCPVPPVRATDRGSCGQRTEQSLVPDQSTGLASHGAPGLRSAIARSGSASRP